MTGTPPECDEQLLLAMLHEQLDGEDTARLISHLDTCQACQVRTEELAASRIEWQLAAKALATPQIESLKSKAWELNTCEDEWRSLTDDALRECLEPSLQPGYLGCIGRYKIERMIGHGGMGIVLKAHDSKLQRTVAIKTLAPFLASNATARKRFARESQAAAAIAHQHVVPIFTVETDSKLPFLVMPFIEGESLQARIDRQKQLEIDEILRIGLDVSAGLTAAHSQGLVHRDIKPSNILLDASNQDRALITDFGLARAIDEAQVTRTGLLAGTPSYMSPEQARGDAIDAQSDLFSLGSMLYTMCTGQVPFQAESPIAILRSINDDQPPDIRAFNAKIPEWFCRLIDVLMAKHKSARYQSASEVNELLAQCQLHLQDPEQCLLPPRLTVLNEQSHVPAAKRLPNSMPWAVVALAFLTIVVVWTANSPFVHWKSGSQGDSLLAQGAGESRESNENTRLATDDNRSSIAEPEKLGFGYARNGRAIFFGDQPVIETGQKNREFMPLRIRKYGLVETIDAASFRALSLEYSKDSDRVYYRHGDPDRFWFVELTDANAESFEVVASYLARDDQRVWWRGEEVQGADPGSLVSVVDDVIWRDSKGVWYESHRIEGADPKTFEPLSLHYYRDKSHVFWASVILEGADPQTFRPFGSDIPFGKDRKAVWSRNRKMDGADPNHFNVFQEHVYRIDDGIYLDSVRIRDVNAASFRKLTNLYGPTTALFTDGTASFVFIGREGGIFRVELGADGMSVTQEIVDWNLETPRVVGEAKAELTADGWKNIVAPESFEALTHKVLALYKPHFQKAKQILENDGNR